MHLKFIPFTDGKIEISLEKIREEAMKKNLYL